MDENLNSASRCFKQEPNADNLKKLLRAEGNAGKEFSDVYVYVFVRGPLPSCNTEVFLREADLICHFKEMITEIINGLGRHINSRYLVALTLSYERIKTLLDDGNWAEAVHEFNLTHGECPIECQKTPIRCSYGSKASGVEASA